MSTQQVAETESLSADLAGAIGIVDQLRRGLLASTFGVQVACDWVGTLLKEAGKQVKSRSRLELYEFVGVTPEELAEWQKQARQAGLQRFRQVTGDRSQSRSKTPQAADAGLRDSSEGRC